MAVVPIREVFRLAPITLGEPAQTTTTSDNVCSVFCEDSRFPWSEQGREFGRRGLAITLSTLAVGVMSTLSRPATVSEFSTVFSTAYAYIAGLYRAKQLHEVR